MDDAMTEEERMESVLFYMEKAVTELDMALHNASQVKGNIYRKVDGVKTRINTLIEIERNKRGM